jgi:hypothetical protein
LCLEIFGFRQGAARGEASFAGLVFPHHMIAMIASLMMSTDSALPAERLKAFLLIARGMANFASEIDP